MSSVTAGAHVTGRKKPLWLDLLTTVDHKKLGLMYLVTSFAFFALGGLEALWMRLQLSQPNLSILTGEFYNQILSMHGSTMQFLFIIPIAAGFANYFLPLMIGARDMALPRMNAFAYWLYLFGGLLIYAAPIFGGFAEGGWVAYFPFSSSEYQPGAGLDTWILGLQLVGFSSIFGGINFIVTSVNLRTPGMGWRQFPMFGWAMLATSFLQVIATPGITAATMLTYLDRTTGISWFNPAIGGDPVLYQHLFWFYSHPAVYIMVLPWFGIVSEILPTFTRKPIFGYTALAGATMGIALVSFLVWAHHMFTSMGSPILNAVFAFTTMLVAVPTGVKIFNWLATIWRGKVVFNTAMLMCLGFIFLFTIAGISGVALGVVPFTWQMHDSYWVVAHFHNVLVGGSIFIVMAAVFYWFPKMTGRVLDEGLGKWLFWLWFVGFMVTYFPQYILGILGMPRRIYTYQEGIGWELWNMISSVGAFMLAAGFLVFLLNIFISLRKPKTAGDNPWGHGYTLEWATSSPPPEYNFGYELPSEFRSERPLYDWKRQDLWPAAQSRSLRPADIHLPNPSFWPFVATVGLTLFLAGLVLQGPLWIAGLGVALFGFIAWSMEPAFESEAIEREVQHHNRSKTNSGLMSAYWFLASEVALFAMMFSGYFYLLFTGRMVLPEELPSLQLALINTLFLVSSSVTVHYAHHGLIHKRRSLFAVLMGATLALGAIFIGITGIEWETLLAEGDPRKQLYLAVFFSITGLHLLHVVIGLLMLAVAYFRGLRGDFSEDLQNGLEVPALYWHLVDGVWIFVLLFIYALPQLYTPPEQTLNPTDPFAVYLEDSFIPDEPVQREESDPIPVLPSSTSPSVTPDEFAPGRPEQTLPGPTEPAEPKPEALNEALQSQDVSEATPREAPAEAPGSNDPTATDTPGGGESGPLSIVEVDTSAGEAVFANCAGCHQANGLGIPGAFPPLAGHIPLLAQAEGEPGGRPYLVNLVLNGLTGQIEVDGAAYNGAMPPFNYLSDEQIAEVLNYALTAWDNDTLLPEDFPAFRPDEVAAERAKAYGPTGVYELRQGLEIPQDR